MNPKYICMGCGHIWRSGEKLAICPACRGKGVKIKEGVNMSNSFKSYCLKCKRWYFGWGKNFCSVCGSKLLDPELKDEKVIAYRKQIKSESSRAKDKKEGKLMNFYRCEKCGILYQGWADSLKCRCGAELTEISEKEYKEEKEYRERKQA